MTCDEVRRAVMRGETDADGVAAHARGCEVCGALLAGGASLARLLAERASDVPVPATLVEAVRRAVEADAGTAGAPRSASTRSRNLVAAATSVVVFAVVFAVMRRPDLAHYPDPRMALALGSLGVGLAVVIALALRPLHAPPVTDGRQRAVVIASVLGCVALAALPAAHLTHPASLEGAGADLFPRAVKCFLFGVATGAPALLVLRALDRWTPPALWPTVLGTLGLGLAGNLALQLHCPITHPAHLLLGHATVALAGVALGFAMWRSVSRRAA